MGKIVLAAIFILALTAADASSGERPRSSLQPSGPAFKVEKVWGYPMRSPGVTGSFRTWENRFFLHKGFGVNSFRRDFQKGFRQGYRQGFRDGFRARDLRRFRRDIFDWND